MSRLKNLSIAVKVLVAPVLLILTLAIVSALAFYGLSEQRTALSEVHDLALEKIVLVQEFITLSEQVQSDVFRISVVRLMDLPDEEVPSIQARLEQGVNNLNVIYGQIITEWSLDETERTILDRMKEPMDAFALQAQQAADAVSENPSFGILLVRSATAPFAEFRGTLAELLDYQQRKIALAESAAKRKAQTVSTAIIWVSIIVAVIGAAATLLAGQLISHPVRRMTGVMRRLADGNLDAAIPDVDRQDEIGEMAHALEVFRDNAIARAGAEEALRISEENYRAIFNSASDAIYVHDATTGAIIDVNARTCEMYGYTIEEIRRVNVEVLSAGEPPYSQQQALINIRKAAEGEPQIFEWLAKDKSGKLFWTEVNLKRAVIGDETRLLAIVRDITERKQAEEALRKLNATLEAQVAERTAELRQRAVELETALAHLQEAQDRLVRSERLAAIGELAASVAHELRNPLGTIRASAFYLKQKLSQAEDLDKRVGESVQLIESQVLASDKIIEELLDFARGRPPDLYPSGVNDVAQAALAMASLPGEVTLITQWAEGLPQIPLDAFQMHRVFLNLITNAAQAMPQGGRLEMRTWQVDGDILVSVSDTGVGISPENQARIFEPLFTNKVHGTGLGLAICQRIVTAHGGRIEVESPLADAKGSRFTVRLPVENADARD